VDLDQREGVAMSDPLLDLVQEYRRQLAIYVEAPSLDTFEAEDAFAYETFRPAFDRLCTNPPTATSKEGALEAIRLVIHEEETCGNQPDLTVNVLRAALAFLDGAVE
jgi:hypothetical protein